MATCSSVCRAAARWTTLLVVAGALFGAPASARAQSTITQDQALRIAFPAPLRAERRTAYLDAEQLNRASRLAGHTITQSVVTYYVATNDRAAGVAYFDSHRVRTHGEVLMFVVDAAGRIRHTEVLRFAEPPEYRAPQRWLDLLGGKTLSAELSLKRDMPNISGATLTAQAVTQAARRVLALHQVIDPLAAP